MQEGFWMGNDAEAERTLATLENLVRDLRCVRAGTGPTFSELQYAPLLDCYHLESYLTFCLSGQVTGHPVLGDARIHTSQLWAMNQQQGWARTFSRYYRLGDSLRDLREELERRIKTQTPPQ
jgi:hypothetical protein